MTLPTAHEHFIPVRVCDLIEILCEQIADATARDDFRRFAVTAAAHVHARYLDLIKELKHDYEPFNPDTELRPLRPLAEEARPAKLNALFDNFATLLGRANYKRLTRDELEAYMRGASHWGVDMFVPFDAYEKLDVYVRGVGETKRTRRPWWRLFRTEEVSVPTFSRVVVMLKQAAHPALGNEADTRNVFLKLFKEIPRVDIEMLLPGTRIRMALVDRLKLGGSGIGSLGYVLWKLQTMIAPLLKAFGLFATGAWFGDEGFLGLLALYTPLALIGGYAYKTYANFTTTKQTYQLQLSQSLYFQSLDSNAGVIFRLLDAAEEQETREVLLGYYHLWRAAGDGGWTAAELDAAVEADLGARFGGGIDFEVHDAIAKLEAGGAIAKDGERYRAVPIRTALERLDDVWEKYAHAT